MNKISVFFLTLLFSATGRAGGRTTFFEAVAETAIPVAAGRILTPSTYATYRLDAAALERDLAGLAVDVQLEVDLPLPGGLRRFLIQQAPIMAPELAARYPDIITFAGHDPDNRSVRLRGDLTPAGFHAMVRMPSGDFFIDPYQPGDRDFVLGYAAADLAPTRAFPCRLLGAEAGDALASDSSFTPYGETLLTYRLALAATGEYTQFHGGTLKAGLAAVVTTLNRVDLIYETELTIRFLLVAGNDALIYTDAGSDPYDNSDIAGMSLQNQTNIDSVIGPANYDLGHVFGTIGGGTAILEGLCQPGLKARAASAQSVPQGDPFDVDYVAHEIGHQLGALHVFNGTSGACLDQRNPEQAFEPGSGSSIMGYAGLCAPENLQDHSDTYFHAGSLLAIAAYTRAGLGNGCAVSSPTGNTPPVVVAGADFTIPMGTPFTLAGTAVDGEADPLLYSWEEADLGAAGPPNSDNGDRPIFRGFAPTATALRTFPRLGAILGLESSPFESLPQTTRTLTFRLTARDGGGGVGGDLALVSVRNDAGPFTVDPIPGAWQGGEVAAIGWDTAGTDLAPISCDSVAISFSSDGGFTYQLLAGDVPNLGTRLVEVPNLDTTAGRIRVACSGNIFFAVCPADFQVISLAEICSTNFANWTRQVAGTDYRDQNGNGAIDVADFVFCGVAP